MVWDVLPCSVFGFDLNKYWMYTLPHGVSPADMASITAADDLLEVLYTLHSLSRKVQGMKVIITQSLVECISYSNSLACRGGSLRVHVWPLRWLRWVVDNQVRVLLFPAVLVPPLVAVDGYKQPVLVLSWRSRGGRRILGSWFKSGVCIKL